MRKCWNRQTGTFEVRVSMTCGFKSHLPHQKEKDAFGRLFLFGAVGSTKPAQRTSLCPNEKQRGNPLWFPLHTTPSLRGGGFAYGFLQGYYFLFIISEGEKGENIGKTYNCKMSASK